MTESGTIGRGEMAPGATREAGFMKALTVLVIAAGVLLVAFAVLSSSIGSISPSALSGGAHATAGSGNSSGNSGGPDPMLSFLNNSSGQTGGTNGSGQTQTGGASGAAAGESPYARVIELGSGTASYAIQPSDEYVTLRDSGSEAVDITGWTLSNSKGARPVQNSGNNYFYPTGQSLSIGQGTEFLDPSGSFQNGDIVLMPGDTAIVTTSGPFIPFPFSITTSFRENKCEGYLKNYPFDPPLSLSCPYPSDDPAIGTVTQECEDYIQSLGRCENPDLEDNADFKLQTSECRAFMTARLDYPGCVSMHRYDADFSQSEWRVFLGRGQTFWSKTHDTITLRDRQGLVVAQVSY